MQSLSSLNISGYALIDGVRKEQEAKGLDTTNLLVGDPDHAPPEVIKRFAREAIDVDFTGYTDQQGDPELRDILADLVTKEGIKGADAGNIFVSSGSKPIAFGIVSRYVGPGQSLVLSLPYYASYIVQGQEARGNALFSTSIDQTLGYMAQDSVKAVLLVTPNNPDGIMLPNEDVMRVIEAARGDQIVIMDEAYKDFYYSRQFHSIGGEIDFSAQPNVAIVRTFSKALGICGWRIGYSISGKELAQKLKKFQAGVLNPPNSIGQYAIREGVQSVGNDYYKGNRLKYKGRLERLVSELSSNHVQAAMPEGALYLWVPPHPGLFGEGTRFETATHFAHQLATEKRIFVWPGKDYGADDYVRISMARVADEKIPDIARSFAEVLHG